MAFNKFDPETDVDTTDPVAERRAWLLKVATWVTLGYTIIGFVFIGLILVRGQLF